MVFVARRDGPRVYEPIGMDYQTKFAQCAPLTHINRPLTNDARKQSYFPPPTDAAYSSRSQRRTASMVIPTTHIYIAICDSNARM